MKRILIAFAILTSFGLTASATSPPAADVHTAVVRAAATDPTEQKVVFNTHSLKYHCASCSAAKRCTKNCITTTLADAKARGGVACKICGGTCGGSGSSSQSRPVQHVRCCDGTFSPSCTYVHSGCCSHHGGVCQ